MSKNPFFYKIAKKKVLPDLFQKIAGSKGKLSYRKRFWSPSAEGEISFSKKSMSET